MRLFRDKHGVISVFLAIILVPSIVASCLFVDLGRIYMSQSTAEASSDLALNSLLTQYDTELNEWYGIVASCQTIDEFYDESAQFFLRTVSSQGLTDEELYSVSAYYADATGDDSIYDFLQVTVESDATITAVEGTDLSNPAMLKDKIVEFMKYRAPIEIVTNLMDRFSDEEGEMGLDGAVQAEENEELVDDKIAFYTAEGELLEAAYDSYIAIQEYSNYTLDSGETLTNDILEEYTENLDGYKKQYEDMHTTMVKDLYNTEDLSKYSRVVVDIDAYEDDSDCTVQKIYTSKDTEDGETIYYINDSKITVLIEDLEDKIDAYNTAKDNYESAIQSLSSKSIGTESSDAYNIQWWVQFEDAVNSSGLHDKLESAAKAMIKSYAKVLIIEECTYDEDVDIENFESTYGYNAILDDVESIQRTYLKSDVTSSSDTYLKAVTNAETISKANIGIFTTEKSSITSSLSSISTELKADIADLEQLVEYLDTAIESLEPLVGLVETYRTEMNEWENTANSLETDMAKDDQDDIKDYKADNSYDEITAESVSELKSRLTNIRAQLQTVIDGMESLQYGSKSVVDITSYTELKKAASDLSEEEIGLTNSALETYANTTFSTLMAPTTAKVVALSNLDNSAYNVYANPSTEKVDTPALYIYMYGKFKGQNADDVEENQKELDSGTSSGEDIEKESKDADRYSGGGEDITWEYSDESTYGLGTSILTGLPSLFSDISTGNIDNIRDDIYVVTYLMEMFSYGTYENEGKYDLLDEATQKTLTISLIENGYEDAYSAVEGSIDEEGTWLSESSTDGGNKSLTNHVINVENNTAYGAELEYILYGGEGSTNTENVKAAYSDIYTVRYALNLISGFENFWRSSEPTSVALNSVATTIFGATGGIIPVPVTMVVLIPILTAFETAVDMERLEAGYPVELYKVDGDDWWLAIPSGTDTMAGFSDYFTQVMEGEIPKKNEDVGLFYSDYIMAFLYLGLTGDTSDAMYQRMGEVIQSNISTINNGASYSLTKAYTYFQLDATLRVEPLMITLPIMDDYENGLETNTDWCTYVISTIRGYS